MVLLIGNSVLIELLLSLNTERRAIKKKALIEAERLIIKPYSSENVDGLVNLLMNPEITKTFNGG